METEIEQTKEKSKVKKLVSWEGWKKELGWVVFFALLLFSAYSYQDDINQCREYVIDPCGKCQDRDTAIIENLQAQIGYMKQQNKINIDDLDFDIVNE